MAREGCTFLFPQPMGKRLACGQEFLLYLCSGPAGVDSLYAGFPQPHALALLLLLLLLHFGF